MSDVEAWLDAYFGAARKQELAGTTNVLRFARERMSAAERARFPEDAHIEIDVEGCAYLCIGGRRLLFGGALDRLLDTLALDRSCIELDPAQPSA